MPQSPSPDKTAHHSEPAWSLSVQEAFKALGSSPQGLGVAEVARRQKEFGPNAIAEKTDLCRIRILFRQFKSPLFIVLSVAGVLTGVLGEWLDFIVIACALAVNAGMGFWQEYKAETVLESLKSYTRIRSRVRRQGHELEIDASEIVPGDIIHVSQGDRIPADCRLIFTNSLEMDESILTGESLPVAKKIESLPAATALPERSCMLWSGTLAVQGLAEAIVTETDDRTEFGRIAAMASATEKESTPLQSAVNRFAVRASLILGALTAVIFAVGLLSGYGLLDMFLVAVAIGIAAVPEGLPVALTVILAIGVERLAKRGGVVRKLLAAETLGSTSIILTDKTGTLTQAVMEISGVLPLDTRDPKAKLGLLRDAVLNTDVVIENPEDPYESWKIIGRAMEASLVRDAAKHGVILPSLSPDHLIIERLPFNSTNKFSAVITTTKDGYRLSLMGAPEILLAFCDLPPTTEQAVRSVIEARAASGERILGVIAKDSTSRPELTPAGFRHFSFQGLLAFRDPLRPGVAEQIARIRSSGVKTVIVTGDHRGTAESIARQIGILEPDSLILDGGELAKLSKVELLRCLDKVRVFARVTPEQKLMLVGYYRENGEVVAVTGDGVNDAPALHDADIGIAVGSGTEVAKAASDLILLKDDFGTIVAAIEQGRTILNNIRKVIVYLLSDSLGGLFLIGGSLIFGLHLPLNALQILFVNLFSDSFPAVAFAFEDGHRSRRRPLPLAKNLMDREMRFLVLVVGTAGSLLLFILYVVLDRLGYEAGLVRTFVFATFGSYTLLVAFSLRIFSTSIFRYNPFSNLKLTAGVGIGLALMLLAIYLPPLQSALDTVPLPAAWLAAVVFVGLLNVMGVELGKFILNRRART
ncbi:cation-transporting P-type ATPase [Candidatus Uhrbacteria bacterium]|nr:cation-transporting P-type ATPase [Candidatus Uhrbacteria bacterium]